MITFEDWANIKYDGLEQHLNVMYYESCCDPDAIWGWMEEAFNAGKLIGAKYGSDK